MAVKNSIESRTLPSPKESSLVPYESTKVRTCEGAAGKSSVVTVEFTAFYKCKETCM